MSDKTKKPANPSASWTAVRQHLSTLEKPALLALVKDLFDAAAGNRDFIHARCQSTDGGSEVLERYRVKVIAQFFSNRADGMGPLKLGEARKAIRDYRKASGSIAGTAELLMTFVESGARFTREYGDIGESFYNSVESALDELASLLLDKGRDLHPQLRERLAKVEQITTGIGWGFHDFIAGVVLKLESKLGNP
jgi:hypothetical protein